MPNKEPKKGEEKKKKDAATEEATQAVASEPKKKTSKKRKNVTQGRVNVYAGYNNTIVTIADPLGNTLAWSSAGASGFKGTKKSTPYAAQIASENATNKAKVFGLMKVDVFINGVGNGREQALRGLIASGLEILSITDVTPLPHNGCRKRRTRRV